MTVMTSSASEPSRRLGHLPGLDGLRGVAVLLVLLYHLEIGGFDGGFLGVDVFFVLSGFLITSLLLAEVHDRSTISLVAFWLRRARRLLPAVFVLLTAVSLLALTIDATLRARLRWDAITSLFYVVNWRFVATGQSYAAESTDPSMLGHLWSLAIEEQFYVLWPLAVLAGATVVRRRWPNRGRAIALVTVGAAAIASAIALALAYDRFDPSPAYFATHTRAFEPLAGAWLAVALVPRQYEHARANRRGGVGFDIAVVAAALALAWGVATLTFGRATYYRGGAVLITAATCAAIVAIVGGSRLGSLALDGRILGALGKVSYGLYLWHWPVIVWLDEDRTGWTGAPLLVARVFTFSALTIASYRFIEQPIRSGRLRGRSLDARLVFRTAALAAVVIVFVAIAATSGAEPVPEYLAEDKSGIVEVEGDTEITVALIGDSVARSLGPGMEAEVAGRGDGYAQATFGGCSVGTLLRTKEDGTPFRSAQRCVEWTTEAFAELVDGPDPDIVIWYSQRERYGVELDGKNLTAGTPQWRDAVYDDWDSTLARLTEGGARVALVLPLYADGVNTEKCEGEDPMAVLEIPTCAARGNALSGGPLRAFYREWAARHPDTVIVVDLLADVCGDAVECDSKIGDVDLRPDDGIHFSPEGAALVAPIVLDAIDGSTS